MPQSTWTVGIFLSGEPGTVAVPWIAPTPLRAARWMSWIEKPTPIVLITNTCCGTVLVAAAKRPARVVLQTSRRLGPAALAEVLGAAEARPMPYRPDTPFGFVALMQALMRPAQPVTDLHVNSGVLFCRAGLGGRCLRRVTTLASSGAACPKPIASFPA